MAVKSVSVFALILAVLCYFYLDRQPMSIRLTEDPAGHYDFIVVGSGSAGAVVASRISENPDITVLLLEAGPADDKEEIHIPLLAGSLLNSDVDWQYKTVPQEYCCDGLNNRQMQVPRGKVLGGSSSINTMAYVRGSRYDFDKWEADGCADWGYDDVLPYFIKAEHNKNIEYAANGYHGTRGPLKVSDSYLTEITDVFSQAAQELGIPQLDVNGPSQYGFSYGQATIDHGRRMSTSQAYLSKASSRENLHVVTKAHVSKIIFDDKTAVGVTFTRNGQTQTIIATREVILSAGAIGSPHILLLSGVGPKRELDKFKIPVVADLPVGENLHDQPFTPDPGFTLQTPISLTEQKVQSRLNRLEYDLFGTGIFGGSIAEVTSFFRSPHQPEEDKYPYIQLYLSCGPMASDLESQGMHNGLNYRADVFEKLYGGRSGEEGFMMLPILLHPASRGYVRLNSTDPLDHPLINPNTLKDPRDLQHLVSGYSRLKYHTQ